MGLELREMEKLLERMANQRVLVVGDVMLDHYIWGDSGRLSPEAPVPIVHVGEDTYRLGGAANVALNLKSLGAHAVLLGAWGEDGHGEIVEKMLREQGIKFINTGVLRGAPTIVKTRVMARNQQVCRVDREGRPADYSTAIGKRLEDIANSIEDVDAIVISDYSKGLIAKELAQKLLEESVRGEKFVAVDSKSGNDLEIEGVDLSTPNRQEALELASCKWRAGEEFPAELVLSRIWEVQRPAYLAVTLGEEGMLLGEKGEICARIPTVAKEVYDVSGAGDTVIASLTLALLAGASLKDAAHLANLAAGIVVGKLGTAQATPEEIILHASKV